MDDFDILFEEALAENTIVDQFILSERIVAQTEAEFRGLGDDERSRQSEEKDVIEKIKRLGVELNKNKNIKNHRLKHLNDKRAEKRKHIKRNIVELKLRLQDIANERE